MPRTKLQEKVNELKKPKINIIAMYLKSYMRARSLSAEDVAGKLGISGPTFRYRINRPESSWRISEIEKVCKAVGCPPAEVYTALAARK